MARDNGKKSILDIFKVKDLDEDEFDEDLFDEEEEEDDYEPVRTKKSGSLFSRNNQASDKAQASQPVRQTSQSANNYNSSAGQAQYRTQAATNYSQQSRQQQYRSANQNNKLVDFNNSRQRTESYRGKSEVYVIKPQEISESQTITNFLKNGKTIVINMEGLELAPAQRIIDFIGGACYALNGSLQAISANIFIAAPESIEVSGDLREEILNSTTVSPELGRY